MVAPVRVRHQQHHKLREVRVEHLFELSHHVPVVLRPQLVLEPVDLLLFPREALFAGCGQGLARAALLALFGSDFGLVFFLLDGG